MTNLRLINEATDLIIELFEAEGITENTSTIKSRVEDWYNNTEITEAQMLAAAAISGSYRYGTSWTDLVEIKEFYFPSSSIEETMERIEDRCFDEANYEAMIEFENFHIGEIEAAQRDFMWR